MLRNAEKSGISAQWRGTFRAFELCRLSVKHPRYRPDVILEGRFVARKALPLEKLDLSSPDFVKAINSASPLSCALVATALIEKALVTLLSNSFVKCGSAESILSEKGALGDLFKCATAARCLGLVSAGMLKNLEKIAHIRNVFAHSHEFIDFDHKDVREWCMNLEFPETVSVPVESRFIAEAKRSPQEKFRLISLMTYAELVGKARDAKHIADLKDAWDK